MKYLGVDYGKRKIGLSISEGLVATPLKVLEVASLKDALDKVMAVVKKEEIDELVIGVPEGGESQKLTRDFISKICKYVKVVESEETLSSKKALELMIQSGVKKIDREREDAYSAAIILQNFLDSQKEE